MSAGSARVALASSARASHRDAAWARAVGRVGEGRRHGVSGTEAETSWGWRFPTRSRSPCGSQTCSSRGFWSRWGRRGAGHRFPFPALLTGWGWGVGAQPAGSSHEAAMHISWARTGNGSSQTGWLPPEVEAGAAGSWLPWKHGVGGVGPSRGSPLGSVPLGLQQHRRLWPQPLRGTGIPRPQPAGPEEARPLPPVLAPPAPQLPTGPWEGQAGSVPPKGREAGLQVAQLESEPCAPSAHLARLLRARWDLPRSWVYRPFGKLFPASSSSSVRSGWVSVSETES